MTKKELMDGIKKHKVKIICAAAGAAGLTLVALKLSNKNAIAKKWTEITLDSTDKVNGAMKWNAGDEHDGSILLGLHDVTVSEASALAAEALTKVGVDENQVLKEVVVCTVNK
jgi:hypothetical protein